MPASILLPLVLTFVGFRGGAHAEIMPDSVTSSGSPPREDGSTAPVGSDSSAAILTRSGEPSDAAEEGGDPARIPDTLAAPTLLPRHRNSASRRVVVTGRRRPGEAGRRRSVLEGDALLARRGGDLARTLADQPGMGTLATGGVAKPVLNGLHSQRLPVIVDGIRLEGQSWGAEHAPEIDPFLADRLVVVRGGAGVRYGPGALGGAIVAEPAPLPRVPGLHGEAVGTVASNGPVLGLAAKASGGHAFPEGVGWRIQGSGRKGGDLRAPQVVLPNTALEELGTSGAVGWHRGDWGVELSHSWYDLDQGMLSSAHIGNLSDLRHAMERGSPPDTSSWGFHPRRPEQRVGHQVSKLELGTPLPAGWALTTTVSTQVDRRREWDAHRAIDAGLAAMDAPQLDYELRADGTEIVAARSVGGWRTSLGASVERQENEYAGRAFVPNYRAKGAGGWMSLERSGAEAGFDLGARWDVRTLDMWWRNSGEVRNSSSAWDGWSAGAGSTWRLGDIWSVRAHAATAWRPPSAVELRADGLHHGTASIEKGDSSLGTERSWTGQISADGKGGSWSASGSAWATRIDDYIGLRPVGQTVLTVRGAFPAFAYRAVDAVLWGGDATVAVRPVPSCETSLRADLLFTRDQHGDPLPFAPVHRIVAGIDGIAGRAGWLVEARAGPRLEWLAEAEPLPDDYAPPPPSTWLLGFEASARTGEDGAWSLSLSGRNLTNRSWRDPADRLRYFAPRPGASVEGRVARRW